MLLESDGRAPCRQPGQRVARCQVAVRTLRHHWGDRRHAASAAGISTSLGPVSRPICRAPRAVHDNRRLVARLTSAKVVASPVRPPEGASPTIHTSRSRGSSGLDNRTPRSHGRRAVIRSDSGAGCPSCRAAGGISVTIAAVDDRWSRSGPNRTELGPAGKGV